MTIPPPTPSKPDNKPVATPIAKNTHGALRSATFEPCEEGDHQFAQPVDDVTPLLNHHRRKIQSADQTPRLMVPVDADLQGTLGVIDKRVDAK